MPCLCHKNTHPHSDLVSFVAAELISPRILICAQATKQGIVAGAAVQDAAASAAQAARASVRSRTRARRYRHAGTACLSRPPPPARPPRRIYSASFLPTAGELRESFPSCPFRIMSFSEELAIVASRDFRLISSPSVRVRGPGALRGRVWPGPFDPRAPLPLPVHAR